jgi:uncharacterized protein YwgA
VNKTGYAEHLNDTAETNYSVQYEENYKNRMEKNVYVMVKISLYLIKHHTMKMYGV